MSNNANSGDSINDDVRESTESIHLEPLLNDGRSGPQETTSTTTPTPYSGPHPGRLGEATTERSGIDNEKDLNKLSVDELGLDVSRKPSGNDDHKEFSAAAIRKRIEQLRMGQESLNRKKVLLNREQELLKLEDFPREGASGAGAASGGHLKHHQSGMPTGHNYKTMPPPPFFDPVLDPFHAPAPPPFRSPDLQRYTSYPQPIIRPTYVPGSGLARINSTGLCPGRGDFQARFVQQCADRYPQPAKCTLHMMDVFSEFSASELEGGSFWDLVVLTGRPDDGIEAGLWVTTCRNYVTAVWPNSARKIQDMFMLLGGIGGKVLADQKKRVSGVGDDVLVSVSQLPWVHGPRELLISFEGKAASQAEMVESLTWLFAILQRGATDQRPVASGVAWSWRKTRDMYKRDTTYTLSSDVFEPLIVPSHSACWTLLLPFTPCAVDFKTRERPQDMEGLELSFEMMGFLGGLEYEVVKDDGLILYGQRSMAYPMRAGLDCVQWHFQHYNPDRPLHNQIKGMRMPVHDLETLRAAKRHFLGIWPDASITLGTDSVDCTKIGWSAAEEVLHENTRDGFIFGGSIGAPKVLTFNWSQTFKVARSRKNQYMVNFEANLHRMINSPVILYSPSEKRAWMVSFVSVLLHLARARASFQASLGFHVPPCERRGNGGQAAFDCLRANHGQPLKKAAENEALSEEEQKYTIQNYVNEVSAAMECARRESCRAKGTIFRGVREKIIGFELADIARMKPTLRMKQHSLDTFATSGWAPLLDDVQLTFFYEGLPDPIIPSEVSCFPGACGKSVWRTIPRGFNLLAVSLPCLVHLAEHLNGSNTLERRTHEFSWHCPGQVYRICDRRAPHTCGKLQELAPKGYASSPKMPISDGEQVGAVVFRYADGFRTIEESMNREVHDRDSENNLLSGLDRQLPWRESLSLSLRPALGGEDSGYSSGGNRDALASSIQSTIVAAPSSDVSRSEQISRLEDGGAARLDRPHETSRRRPRKTDKAKKGLIRHVIQLMKI